MFDQLEMFASRLEQNGQIELALELRAIINRVENYVDECLWECAMREV